MANIAVDGQKIEARDGTSILEASLEAEIYIPHLCSHPQLDALSEVQSMEEVYIGGVVHKGEAGEAFEGCNLCLVQIEGSEDLQKACKTKVEDGLVITTDSPELKEARQKNLAALLERHPHACLLCAQAEGCDRINCSSNIPEPERCCDNFGKCELQSVSQFIGTEKGLPPYKPLELPVIEDEPLLVRDYNLCIGCLRCARVCKEVKGADALGFVIEDGRVLVGSKAATLKESGCQSCGYCIEVCPTGALTDRDAGVGERENYLIPCKNTCPAGIDAPRYIRFISRGMYDEALAVIREKIPFPSVCGSVCFNPCETRCRRGEIDDPIAVRALKRFAAERGRDEFWKQKVNMPPETGKRVAIVGSGPAGLTAGYYLAKLGHSVTIFESLPEPGGMMRAGILAYRLPREVLDSDIQEIKRSGIEIRTNAKIESLDSLLEQGYDAILLAVGTQRALKLSIENENSPGVMEGISLLKDVNLGREAKLTGSVGIIGGGNVAIDVARASLRLGANEIHLICLESREEMPAQEWEIQHAVDEGIILHCSWGIKRIVVDDKKVSRIDCIRCTSVFDKEGRFNPSFDEGVEFSLDLDTLMVAIGQAPDLSFFGERSKVQITEQGTIKVDATTLQTSMDGVFAAGDTVTGPTSVIEAINDGRRAASSIDIYLGGSGMIDEKLCPPEELEKLHELEEGEKHRVLMPCLSSAERLKGFKEVEIGFDEKMAVEEAKRCFRCDLRFQIKSPVLPPEQWLAFDEETINTVPELEGVYVLYDENKEIYNIVGVINLREGLQEEYGMGRDIKYFIYEEDPMYTGKERQLVQVYMKQHGKMPPGSDDLDDLF
jgi:NADPH-dependent glutamate synthase beta subunit-like oxidoreductase/NAD-dependent dihydropyrimidine dehydrogenase PreA subunit